MTLDEAGRIIKAKIVLGKEKPFFAYLISYLTMKESEEVPTMGVNEKADLFWNRKFIASLDNDVLKGVLCHEVLHLALSHPKRLGGRDHQLANIAQDIVINNIIVNDGLKLPSMCELIPHNNSLQIPEFNIDIHDIDKKCWEEIYDILDKKMPKKKRGREVVFGKGKGSPDSIKAFDEHKYQGKGEQEGKAGKDGTSEEKEWNKRLVEASTYAKLQGNLPKGMDRIIGDLVNNKVDWKRLLQKHMTNEVFSDYKWSRPSRRSQAIGTYLPSSVKENVKVAVAIDTSGSIDQQTLTAFLSEVVHIIKSTSNIKATVMECDCEINQEFEVRNGDIKKIMSMEVKGGGGTSFNPPIEKMLKEKRDIKLLVYLTDGHGDVAYTKKDLPFEIIWVLTKDGTDQYIKDIGRIIKMED